MTSATLLLPERARFAGIELPRLTANALGRGDADQFDSSVRAQLHRQFEFQRNDWSVAALTRSVDATDADTAHWLRADPCYMQPDINGARMLAYGDGLELTQHDVSVLLPDLQTLFVESGFRFDAPAHSRWYLRLPENIVLPNFSAPIDVLGDDLFDHLPEGELGIRWRALMSETQILLHHHPCNARRLGEGKLPINSLWFWGGGEPVGQVQSQFSCVKSNDPVIRALASRSGTEVDTLHCFSAGNNDALSARVLYDLRHLDAQTIVFGWMETACGFTDQTAATVVFDFSDGTQWRVNRGQRWRLWRHALHRLA